MATKKKRRTQEPWPGFDEGLDAVPSGDFVTPGGTYNRPVRGVVLTGAAALRAKRALGICELEGECQKVAGHDGPCTRRNPHEQYYGDEDPEDAERMRRLKAISDAAMARKNPAKKRPTGQCVSCGAVCAVYGDPPICHPCDVVMAQEAHAEREGIPGRPGYKKPPGRKNPSAGRFTAFEAAKEFAKYLKRAGYKDAAAWDREMVQRTGWDPTADAQVALEGGPDLSLLQLYSKGPFKAGMQPWPGVHCGAYSSWLMSFYDRE